MEFERKTSSKPPKISPWESQWRAVKFDLVKRICQRFWPSVSFKSWQDCLAQLYKEKCYANETVVAWIQAGAEDVSSLSLELLRMKPSVGFEYREPSKVVDDDGEDKKAQQTTTAADPSFMLLATPTVPSQQMESPNLTKGKKQKISLRGEKMVSLDQEHAKDTPALVRAVKDGDQHGDDDEDDLSEALHNQAFFDDPESTLDEAKIRKLAKLMPVNIALMETMERREKSKLFKDIPFFNGLVPYALQKDFTSLSKGLSDGKRAKIRLLYLFQLKSRDKLRMCVQRLYEELDLAAPLDKQSKKFVEWETMLYLLLDDMAWAVKLQQKTILERYGYGSLLSKQENSIIPIEFKQQLKELKDFDASFARKSFFSARGNTRGRGGFRPFFPSRRGFQKRGSRKGSSTFTSSRGRSGRSGSVSWKGRSRRFEGGGLSGYVSGGAGYASGFSDDDFPAQGKNKFADFSSFRGRPKRGGHNRQ